MRLSPQTNGFAKDGIGLALREGPPPPGGKVSGLHRWLVGQALRLAGGPPLRVVLWNGEEFGPTGPPRFSLRVRDPQTLWRLFLDRDLGFGDAYSDGRIEVEGDLVAFLDLMYRLRGKGGLLAGLLGKLKRARASSLRRARANIHHHYDVSNEFYQLWLDEQMVYTCAYFSEPTRSLEEAQIAKMDHVCRKLRLRPGQTVIEAGCGWGALARHMARHYGVRVRAFNISHEQIVYARARTRAEGLDGQVEFVETDYRNITGACDAFVSVGMLEHVGLKHYRALGKAIRRTLKPTGLGLIHSIGANFPSAMNGWLEKRIFPGAYIPSLSEMMGVFEPWDFSVLDVENLRPHYAKTLEHWLSRFDAVSGRVVEMFDANFARAWRLYLAGSMAGFTSGWFQLFQIVFSPGPSADVPWTRADIYNRVLGG